MSWKTVRVYCAGLAGLSSFAPVIVTNVLLIHMYYLVSNKSIHYYRELHIYIYRWITRRVIIYHVTQKVINRTAQWWLERIITTTTRYVVLFASSCWQCVHLSEMHGGVVRGAAGGLRPGVQAGVPVAVLDVLRQRVHHLPLLRPGESPGSTNRNRIEIEIAMWSSATFTSQDPLLFW